MDFIKSLRERLQKAETGTAVVSKRSNDFKTKLDSYYHNGQLNGTTTYINALDDHLRWRDGFLYAWSGYPGAGKSTFLSYLMILLAKNQQKKIAIYSPESYPIEDMIEELMRMFTGGSISKGYPDQISLEEYENAMKFINEYFYFLDFDDIPTINDVFGEFSRLVKNEGVGIVIIDPFNSIIEGADMSGGGNISQYLKAALSQSKLFAVKHNVPVNLVEHPRSTGGQTSEDRPAPSPFMIYGGSMWWNKVDIFTTIDRNMFDSNDPNVQINVWKVKKQRLMGKPGEVTLQFDYKTGRYS